MSTSPNPTSEHIVVLIHGIRTHAAWAEMVSDEITKVLSTYSVRIIRYGFFDAIRFLFPWITRRTAIQRVIRELRDIRTEYPTAKISVIAHSFGTYAIAKALSERDIHIERIIFCGSIVSDNFRRADYGAQLGHDPILNDCGTNDIWPILAKSATWGYGPTGTFGFGTVGIRDRFNQFGHSGYFNSEFVHQYWLPFLERGVIQPTEWERNRSEPPYWHSLPLWMPIRWLAVILIVLFLGFIANHFVSQIINVNVEIITRKTMKHYSSYVTLSGSTQDCKEGRCRVVFHDAAYVIGPAGSDLSYVGRAATSGRILSIKTSPPVEILNSNQWPANPTYLMFKVSPASPDDRFLRANGELTLEQRYCPESGKIGPYVPYDTRHAVFVLDTRLLQFVLHDVRAEVETRRSDGKAVPGYIFPELTSFEGGKVFLVTADNLVGGSSLYIKWGDGGGKCP